MHLIESIRTWWRRLRRHRRFKGVAWLDSGADPSRDIKARRLILVGPSEKPKWLRFACPCRCGQVIDLNLMASHTPRWSFNVDSDGKLTVHPSVDATTCGSHFWIRKSRIDWV
jgi:Family of unknown function (DUF6527)